MNGFAGMLANSLTPITLISGVGLMLLCMVARYNHTTDRIRQLLARREAGDYEREPELDFEIHLIFRRASYLRLAMLSLVLSDVSSGLLLTANVLSHLSGISLIGLSSLFLVLALLLIVVSCACFSLEVHTSLHALHAAIEHLPGKPPLP